MPLVSFPYGTGMMEYEISEARFLGELVSTLHNYAPATTQEELVRLSLEHPIGGPKLRELAVGKQHIVIIASDHTRPVPSQIIIPQMLAEIRRGNPEADVTLLISTGCHRISTDQEMIHKFGEEIVKNERIVMHDCDNSEFVYLGKLPSGGDIRINKIAAEADLLVAEGFIEPHFFAGFSGGRKSVFPGVCDRATVLYNHNAAFIDHSSARAGIVEGNPMHIDMLHAAHTAKLQFICNVIINAKKEVVYSVAGDLELAHQAGRAFLLSKCKVEKRPADIVIVTNGGAPLDQNIYQAVKGISAAEVTVREGGVIIMLARSEDGHGGESFHRIFRDEKDLDRMMRRFLDTPKEETIIDQWQSQIFARALQKARVIYVSDCPDELVRDMHMIPAKTIAEAVAKAEEILGGSNASILAIPDGVAVMVV